MRDEPGDHYREPDEDEFGYCMAMQAMGHGVGWDDNHPSMFHEKHITWDGHNIHRPQVFKVPHIKGNYIDDYRPFFFLVTLFGFFFGGLGG